MSRPRPEPFSPDLTVAAARHRVGELLREAGIADAAVEARIFIEDGTGFGRAALFGAADRLLGEEAAATLDAWVARRLSGEPVFRILGRREFWGLDLTVTPDVLDPRPDTEALVEAALDRLGSRRGSPLQICDLGTGSGAILAALLHECPQARGWGVDRSLAACRVARGNLAALGFASRSLVLQGIWGSALPAAGFDLVVSNPPYIETEVIPGLAREVREHDPILALDGGLDGLDCYRAIAADLPRLLTSGGIAVLEVGAGQAAAVEDLLRSVNLVSAGTRLDLGGHPRAVTAIRA